MRQDGGANGNNLGAISPGESVKKCKHVERALMRAKKKMHMNIEYHFPVIHADYMNNVPSGIGEIFKAADQELSA